MKHIISSFENKNCNINSISEGIYIMFNRSISKGVFSNICKSSRIVPIFKDVDKEDMNNYRPISTLPFISKVFEKLMNIRSIKVS